MLLPKLMILFSQPFIPTSAGKTILCHSEGFKLKYGRYPKWDEEEAFCDEFWFDPIFLTIRELVRKRTGK